MRQEEIKLLAAQDVLRVAKREHNKAVKNLEIAYGRGLDVTPYHKKEQAARRDLMAAENRVKKAENAVLYANAISDDEIDAIVAYIHGDNQQTKPKELSDEDEGLCKMIVDNL